EPGARVEHDQQQPRDGAGAPGVPAEGVPRRRGRRAQHQRGRQLPLADAHVQRDAPDPRHVLHHGFPGHRAPVAGEDPHRRQADPEVDHHQQAEQGAHQRERAQVHPEDVDQGALQAAGGRGRGQRGLGRAGACAVPGMRSAPDPRAGATELTPGRPAARGAVARAPAPPPGRGCAPRGGRPPPRRPRGRARGARRCGASGSSCG
ncbi:MAG: hypothetical protein ACK559_25685, partial [bacterium]